jgi:hypothetical protein
VATDFTFADADTHRLLEAPGADVRFRLPAGLATQASALSCAWNTALDEGEGELGTLIVTEGHEGAGLDMAVVEDLIRRADL